jgi:two-component system chemotaxis sensor kinase CheA
MANDPYKYFRVEARELLDQLGRGVLDLEKSPSTSDLVARLLRLAHTLKGAARVVKQREIADHSHAVEDVLAPYRETPGPVPRDLIDLLLKLVDGIGKSIAGLAPPPDQQQQQQVDRPSSKQQGETPLRTVRADIAEVDELLDGVAEAHTQLSSVQRSVSGLERARHLVDLVAKQLAAPRARGAERSRNGEPGNKTHSLVEELESVIGTFDRNLASGLEQMDRELRQIRESAERLRLLPASSLFSSLERTARDVAQAQGKCVVFEVKGGDVRLDAHVLGEIQPALMQIVRNALAHGIESESDRIAAGKPPEGRVVLEVSQRRRRVAFVCRDDGRGVDLEAVRRAAQRKGGLSKETDGMGTEDLLRFLLVGGISTSGTVTEVSGRGIGLDVVREAVERLGGEVAVRTERGKGTTLELTVPLSLASLETLVIETSGVAATIPLDAVRSSVRLAPEEIARTAQGDTIVYEGKVIPFLPLARIVMANAPSAGAVRHWSAVIVEAANGIAAVGVDRLLGTTNLVLHPLPELAHAAAVVAGASFDSQGAPQIVLDPDGLVAEAQRERTVESQPQAMRPPILVIDDSLTTRMLEQSILESAGYLVEIATSGEDALEKASQKRYWLFLVDVEMPGIDGFTFIERTRSDADLRDISSILVSSRDSPEDHERGRKVGAQAYIVKGEFNQGQFLERVRKLVG